MVKIEMPSGAQAILQNGEWLSPTLGLANLLEAMMGSCDPSPDDGDLERVRADHVARRLSVRILECTPSYEHVSVWVY